MKRKIIDNHHLPILKLFDSSLRLLVIPLGVATSWVTVNNHQDDSTFGKLDFKNFTGLKYLVCISVISAAYAFIAVIFSWLKFFVNKAWLFFVSDQVIAYLVVTSMAGVAEILYLAYIGDREVTWSEACTSYGKFCGRMKVALVLHGFTLCCFLILAVISAYRTFSSFEPPQVSASDDIEERT